MNYDQFYCSRDSFGQLVSVVQRNILLREYCDRHFYLFNYIDIFYRSINENIRLFVVLLCLTLVYSLMMIRVISQKGLGESIINIKKEFKINSILLSSLVVPISYKFCFMVSYDFAMGDGEDNFLIMSSFLSYCILMGTIGIGVIVYYYKDEVRLPKRIVQNDLLCLLAAIILIGIFGWFKKVNWGYPIGLMVIYACNIFFKIRQNKAISLKKDARIKIAIEAEKEVLNVLKTEKQMQNLTRSQVQMLQETEPQRGTIRPSLRDKLVPKTKWEEITDEIMNVDSSFIVNLFFLPVNVIMLLTIPYPKNPLRKTFYRYVLAGITTYLFLSITFYMYIPQLVSVLFGIAAALLLTALSFIPAFDALIEIVLDFTSIIGSLTIVKLLDMQTSDVFEFFWFYFKIVRVVHYCLFLVLNMSITDIFSNIHISINAGKAKLGLLSVYSTAVFSLVPFLAIFSIGCILSGKPQFILFTERGVSTLTYIIDQHSRVFFKYIYITMILVIVITFVMLEKTGYVMTKKIGNVLFGTVGVYIVVAIIYGFSF
jgi:hypothetical protein